MPNQYFVPVVIATPETSVTSFQAFLVRPVSRPELSSDVGALPVSAYTPSTTSFAVVELSTYTRSLLAVPVELAVIWYASAAPAGAEETLVPTVSVPAIVVPGGGDAATVSVTGIVFGEPVAPPPSIVTLPV